IICPLAERPRPTQVGPQLVSRESDRARSNHPALRDARTLDIYCLIYIMEVVMAQKQNRRRPSISREEGRRGIAKVFWSGRSQAIRLPKDFRLSAREVRI